MNAKKNIEKIIVNKTQLLIGILVLGLGILVYVVLRSPDKIYFTRFLGIHHVSYDVQSPILITIGNRLPAFLHVFGFVFITASFFSYAKRTYTIIAIGWFFTDALFELGQKYKIIASRLVSDIFDQIPFLESTKNYFLLGTFDIFDLVAYALGALMAFLILMATAKPGSPN